MTMLSGLLIILSALVPVGAGEGTWVSTAGQIQFDLSHPFHDVTGVSDGGEAVVMVAGGAAKVVARVRINSFRSGNGNRDQHMLEITEATKYPLAIIRFVVNPPPLPPPGTKAALSVRGELQFHGVKTKVPVAIELASRDGQTAVAAFSFYASLDAHGVERPSLLFIKTDDEIKLSGSFELRPGS